MRYEDFLRTRIYEPLGMTHSSQDRSLELMPDRAVGYQGRHGSYPVAWWNGMTRANYVNAHYQLMLPPQGDAGLVTTARDLYRWDQALYTEKLVKRPMLDSIFTPGLGNYGYGWFINHGPDGVSYEHSGGLPGFTCYIMRIPATHRTIILLTNTDRLGPTVRDLARIMRGQPVATPTARHLIVPDSTRSAALVGIYRVAQGDSVVVERRGAVLIAGWGEHFRTALFPESARDYFAAGIGGTIRFQEQDGRMGLVVLDEFGKEMVRGEQRAKNE
jgi:CubicO group peptidase (beta-lactamase class C family)